MSTNKLCGQIVDDAYQIISLIGEGGVGSVYLAEQKQLNRQVAIKILRGDLLAGDKSLKRFQREGKILASLLHPGIVRCYAFGLWQNKLPYLVFEFVNGKTLRAVLAERKVLPWDYVLKLSLSLLSALAYAHTAGVIHRDLKPENIIVLGTEAEPDSKILDFGLARIADSESEGASTLTGTGQILGTANYMSPEQCQGKKSTAASDLYALACIMFESLTGTPPFFADTPVSIIYKHLNQPVPLPSSSIDSIPETVDAIVLRALAKEASQRYENAEAMAQDIMRVLDSGARAGLTAAGIQLSPEQRATIEELRHTNIFERWRLSYAIPLAVLGISALLFLVSDPGPAIFCELESNFLSPSDRVHYLESSADYFISVSRFRAAYRLLTRELQESRAASDKLVQARILSKLALCSFSFDAHKNAAIDHATESLSRSFVYGRETGRFDEASIVRAARVIQESDAIYEPQLGRGLQGIMSDLHFKSSYASVINCHLAVQSTPLPDRLEGRVRICNLLEGLLVAQSHDDKTMMYKLIETARKPLNRQIGCRGPLLYFFDSVEEKMRHSHSPRVEINLPVVIMQSFASPKAGSEAEKIEFATCLFKSKFNSGIFGGGSDELVEATKSAKLPLLRAFLDQLAARVAFVTGEFPYSLLMMKQAMVACRLVDSLESLNKKAIFNDCEFIQEIPVTSSEKFDVARLIFSEGQSQHVALLEETVLAIAIVIADEQPHSVALNREIESLLTEAQHIVKERERVEERYLQSLIRCIALFKANGETEPYRLARKILEDDAQEAQEPKKASYYQFLADEDNFSKSYGGDHGKERASESR